MSDGPKYTHHVAASGERYVTAVGDLPPVAPRKAGETKVGERLVSLGFVAVCVRGDNRIHDPIELLSPTVYVSMARAQERAARYVARHRTAESAIGVEIFAKVPTAAEVE